MTVLVIAEHDNASLKASTLHTVTAASQCGAEVHVLVAGHACLTATELAAKIDGVAKVLAVDAPQFADGLAENLSEQVVALARSGLYSHIMAPATVFGKSVLPRVAAKMDIGQISEITKVISPDIFERPIYAGSAVATVQALDLVKAVTVRTVSFNAAGSAAAVEIEHIVPAAHFGGTRFISRDLTASERPELTSARIVVAGGRGLGSAENFKILAPLVDKLGAAMGASRAAVDAGFVPNDLQIGQTGKVVAPEIYFAVGISGAVQHLAGMSDSKIIVAINKDPEAPIFGVADYGIVGDLFAVVPELVAGL